MLVIAIEFIPLLPLSIVSTIPCRGKDLVYWPEKATIQKEVKESINRYSDSCDITQMMLKTALNTMQSVNQSIKQASNQLIISVGLGL